MVLNQYCISVGDFNNDNISDIAVANAGTNNIVVLFGFGDGSFLLGTAYSTGTASVPFALTNGDFNKDGRLDIAVANSQSSPIGIFLADGIQPFGAVTTRILLVIDHNHIQLHLVILIMIVG